jgi:putative ABC transport system ATP-binding protein
MISISGLDFSYPRGDFRLRIPKLMIEDGPSVAVIGPSGSGKTTLLNLIAGVIVPQAGRITLDGTELNRLDDCARREFRVAAMGLVFQEFELVEYLNVFDNIVLPYRISPKLRLDRAVRDKVVELAGQVGIGDKLKRYTHQMSQGEKQRVAVCRALLTKPRLVLADEPTGNLDRKNKAHVLDILFEYAAKSCATVVAVTHDLSVADRFDHVIDFEDFNVTYAASDGAREGGDA